MLDLVRRTPGPRPRVGLSSEFGPQSLLQILEGAHLSCDGGSLDSLQATAPCQSVCPRLRLVMRQSRGLLDFDSFLALPAQGMSARGATSGKEVTQRNLGEADSGGLLSGGSVCAAALSSPP